MTNKTVHKIHLRIAHGDLLSQIVSLGWYTYDSKRARIMSYIQLELRLTYFSDINFINTKLMSLRYFIKTKLISQIYILLTLNLSLRYIFY